MPREKTNCYEEKRNDIEVYIDIDNDLAITDVGGGYEGEDKTIYIEYARAFHTWLGKQLEKNDL